MSDSAKIKEAEQWLQDTLSFVRENMPKEPIYIQPARYNNLSLAVDNIEKSMGNYETLGYYWRMKGYNLEKIKKYIEAYKQFKKDADHFGE